MDTIPMEWIDKLFHCMSLFYGERWNKKFSNDQYLSIHKTVWQTALQGLTYEQIKNTLVILKRTAKRNGNLPPNQLQFYYYARRSMV